MKKFYTGDIVNINGDEYVVVDKATEGAKGAIFQTRRPSAKYRGCLVSNNGAITVRYDRQTGKFVEVEHDEARAAEAYEILRVLNI